ncbi:sensor histidine kinase YesM [Paenibacillus shirakamiensis]|uniref:Sensor histidine kinase YesM n=1 Tax=Paenibacillus shirakamiensis TaxID=1265935 RepID=A0ABS4JEL4_9BACL|nr:sensor histidine kinase [Paenibacillus shirakamiensis]MBP1999406.1 sensor histidine kinase YesM [Paenibacillus shirakamiensis]
MNLRIKLLTAFILLIIIPIFILGIITFFITFKSIETKYSEQAEYGLTAISYSISSLFGEMDRVTNNGIEKDVYKAALLSDNPNKQDLTTANQIQLNDAQRNFRTILFSHPSIDFAFLYNIKGTQVISIFNKESFKPLQFSKFKQTQIFNEMWKRNGAPVWVAPHEYPELTGSDSVFTQIRLIKDTVNLKNLGILIVQIKNEGFEDVFKNLKLGKDMQDTRFLLINNSKGQILYDNAAKLDGTTLETYLSKSVVLGTQQYQSFKGKFNGNESVISVYKLKDHPWSIVSVTSWSYLSSEIMVFAKWFVGIIVICVFAAVLFNVFFMNRITGTIGVIVRFMRKVEDGDFSARVDEKGDDELLLLQKGFNNQMDKISELFEEVKLEQEKKTNAELRVLQAQIKPHFLFNTLESINILAAQNEGRKVNEMVLRLASILRISFQGTEEISLQLEVEHLINYLEIQKFRFEDLFDYQIDIPNEMMNCMLLKLTLQPLVENTIQHGFEGIEYTGKIKITGEMKEDHILLIVEDNGIGISSERLMQLQYSDLNHTQTPVSLAKNQERRGLGLRSVFDRLRYQYGPKYGLFICSAPGHGTVIQCVIPKYELGDKFEAESLTGR